MRYRASPYTGLVDVDVCPAAEGRQHYDSMPPRGARRRVACFMIRTRADSTSTLVKRAWCRSTRGTTRVIIMRRPSRSRRFPATRGRQGPPSPPSPRRTRRPRRRGSPRDSPVADDDEAETARRPRKRRRRACRPKRRATRRAAASSSARGAASAARAAGSCTRTRPPRPRPRTSPSQSSLGSQGRALW